MVQEITQEQKAFLESFAGKRDTALLEISNLQITKETLEKKNKELTDNYTDTEARLNQVIGRIEELNKKEIELPTLISRDIAQLQSQKTSLETEIMNLSKLVEVLNSQKISLEKDISSALTTLSIVKEGSLSLEAIVNHVTRVSQDNKGLIEGLVSDLAVSLKEIIEVNRKNVLETNTVLDKLPRMLMEAQKRGIIKEKL